ncbi:UNVERIFIED_CONTAM: hypothetical protein NCL1_43166 [Trichonephila clavipes]
MATEIILTLGQAFEVAYQMAIREKPAKSGNKSESGTASCGDDQKRYTLWNKKYIPNTRTNPLYFNRREGEEFL